MALSAEEALFLSCVGARLERGEVVETLRELTERWTPATLVGFFSSPSEAVVQAAARSVGLVGSMRHVCPLVALLGHAQPGVVQIAEDALWRIWMRGGTPAGNAQMAQALKRLDEEGSALALGVLRVLTAVEPTFAEAHHQTGLIHHSLDELELAQAAYRKALANNPYHFAAAAGLGHLAVQRGDLDAALRCYRRALHIHPRLADIAAVVPELEAALERRVVA